MSASEGRLWRGRLELIRPAYRRPPQSGPSVPADQTDLRASPVGTARLAPGLLLDSITAPRYYQQVIRSFGTAVTEQVWRRQRVARLASELQRATYRKLLILDAAEVLQDLRIPPGNRLEQLRGDRDGQHSIRVNDQWRICFTWTDTGPADVELVDYH